eukprot:scaffold4731_cov144-Isochrysis_galbana.AAC.5
MRIDAERDYIHKCEAPVALSCRIGANSATPVLSHAPGSHSSARITSDKTDDRCKEAANYYIWLLRARCRWGCGCTISDAPRAQHACSCSCPSSCAAPSPAAPAPVPFPARRRLCPETIGGGYSVDP